MLNGIMIQFFHWYSWEEGSLWNHLKAEAPKLAELGVTAVWLPPAFKGTDGINSRGYDIYDLYDLGEFDQKGTVQTRYGTKDEYLDCIKILQEHGITAIADIVLNHKSGGDEIEKVWVKKVNPENRNEFISDRFEIDAYTKFTFAGRNNQYSDFKWTSQCFSGVDYDAGNQESAIYSIQNEYGDGWEEVIDTEKGNFDFLMSCDIDYRNPAVRDEIKNWSKWYLENTGFNGIRLDAIKHISTKFINEFLDHMHGLKNDLFVVGEYWAPGDLPLLKRYIEATNGRMSLFDASLHHNMYAASEQGKDYNMATIFDGSLVQEIPELAVTLIDNHDTQPLQALEAPVNPWFKNLAYALILLREKGYPCVFYPDLYGATYTDKGEDGNNYEIYMPKCDALEGLLKLRKEVAFGFQRDYFDHPNCIGWTREGKLDDDKTGCAILMCNGEDGYKHMEIGARHAGKAFYDYLGYIQEEVHIAENGWAEFRCKGGSVSVWVQRL